MGTVDQKKSYRIRFPCSKKLLNKFYELVRTRKIKPNDLIFTLMKKVHRPTEFQKDYEEKYKNKIKKKFGARTTEQTYLDFGMYSAFFRNKSQVLDYLISNEMDSGSDLTYSDYSGSG